MSELDWIEREERYKSRMTRSLLLTTFAAVLFFGTGFYLLDRQEKRQKKAAETAAAAATAAEAKRINDAFTADSTAAAARLAAFKEKHAVTTLEGAPVLVVPIPRGASLTRFLESTWAEYALVADPAVDAQHTRERFTTHFVDVMNRAWYTSAGTLAWEGDMQPTAILLPDLKQKGKDLEFERPSFAQIVRGQEAAGIRAIEEMPADAMAAGAEGTNVDVILTAVGDQRDRVVEMIRELTGLGESDAAAIVDAAPAALKEDVPQAVADEIKRRIEEVGGSIEIRP